MYDILLECSTYLLTYGCITSARPARNLLSTSLRYQFLGNKTWIICERALMSPTYTHQPICDTQLWKYTKTHFLRGNSTGKNSIATNYATGVWTRDASLHVQISRARRFGTWMPLNTRTHDAGLPPLVLRPNPTTAKQKADQTGFEPVRPKASRFQVCPVNHSGTDPGPFPGLNPKPPAPKQEADH